MQLRQLKLHVESDRFETTAQGNQTKEKTRAPAHLATAAVAAPTDDDVHQKTRTLPRYRGAGPALIPK